MLNFLPNRAKVIVIGASRGIGLEFAQQFAAQTNVSHVIAGSRNPRNNREISTLHGTEVSIQHVDICDESSVSDFAALSTNDGIAPSIVINTAGLLHDEVISPEKRLEDINAESMAKSFSVNAIGFALVAKHFVPIMDKERRSIFATLSARVGSISDNRLGGWYAYRASKAAQNMLTRSISIEAKRRAPNLIVVGLHPGTVDTHLSAPFQSNVRPEKLFTPEQSVSHLIAVLDSLRPDDSGKVFAWDGAVIPA